MIMKDSKIQTLTCHFKIQEDTVICSPKTKASIMKALNKAAQVDLLVRGHEDFSLLPLNSLADLIAELIPYSAEYEWSFSPTPLLEKDRYIAKITYQ
ncbi:MAG TPA: hypothetical protein DGK91_13835 [Clostridium sp.]|jgi:hypothetical protein|nr:hypothetical protein [Clostridium sp.]